MLCQDKVLKENWDFNRGELYMIDHKRGQRPHESTIEIAVILWPEHQGETTKWFMVAPITLDVRGLDPKTVQYLAGHENSKTTMDIYAKVKYNRPEELSEVINAALKRPEGQD